MVLDMIVESSDACREPKAQWSIHRPASRTTVLLERYDTYLSSEKWEIPHGALGSSRPIIKEKLIKIEQTYAVQYVYTSPGVS